MPESFNRRLRALLVSHDLQDGQLVTEDVGSSLRAKLLALAAAGHIPQPEVCLRSARLFSGNERVSALRPRAGSAAAAAWPHASTRGSLQPGSL